MLTPEQLQSSLAIKDLTEDPDHCICILMQTIINDLEKKYQIPATIERGSKIVSVEGNYTKLGYSAAETTLSERYTRYLSSTKLLRTQMTSAIPNLLEQYSLEPQGKKLWICPGMVYRRDVVDRTHVGEPHQMDVWLVDDQVKLERKDLLELVETIIQSLSSILKENLEWRYTETKHHYTDNGIEVEIKYHDKWLEILECGLAGRKLLDSSNLKTYSGLALGMGLDRLVMIVKQIDDIRILRDQDSRNVIQMKNLSKYKSFSKQPSIKRDLSIIVEDSLILEELTENIMLNLNSSDLIEEVGLLSETHYNDLNDIARTRLGARVNQKNWLIRISLRHPSRSISKNEANDLYTRIYELVHQGTKGYTITYKNN